MSIKSSQISNEYEAVVSVESPLQLINSLEWCYKESIPFGKVFVFYFLKRDNELKNKQGIEVLNFLGVKGVNFFKLPFKKRYRKSWNFIRDFNAARQWRDVVKDVRDIVSGFSEPKYLVGHGVFLDLMRFFFLEPQFVKVDGGRTAMTKKRIAYDYDISSFWSSRLSWELLSFIDPIGCSKGDKRSNDVIFSVYKEASNLTQNGNLFCLNDRALQRSLASKKSVDMSSALFVSVNSFGELSEQDQYKEMIEDFSRLPVASKYYFPRANEPAEHVQEICRTYSLDAVVSYFPFEFYLYVESENVPYIVCSYQSAALDSCTDIFGSRLLVGDYADGMVSDRPWAQELSARL